MTAAEWVRRSELLLDVLCAAVALASMAAVPLHGWVYGIGVVLGAACWVTVLALSNRVERREHDARDRELTGRPS